MTRSRLEQWSRWLLASLLALVAFGTHAQAANDEAFAFYENALSRLEAGELPEAVVEIKNALQHDPNMLPAHVLLARIYLEAGLPAAADEALKEARRLGGDPAQLWPLRAEAMLRLRRHSDLLDTVPAQGLSPPVQSKLLVLRGHAQLAMGNTAAAEQSYAGAKALAPTRAEPLIAMAKGPSPAR